MAGEMDVGKRGPRCARERKGLHRLMVAYLEHMDLRDRSTTARTAGQALQQLDRWCGAQGVDPLRATHDDLMRYQHWLLHDYRSPNGKSLAQSTASTRVAYIKGWYEWLDIRGEIVCDPARKIGILVRRSRECVRPSLTLQEVSALLQTQGDRVAASDPGTITWARELRDLAALSIDFATGRRIGELTTLRVTDIDLDRQSVRVAKSKGRTGRVLPMATWAVEALDWYLAYARERLAYGQRQPWLFLNARGDGPITQGAFRWRLRGLVEQAAEENADLDGLRTKTITWHSLRRAFASIMNEGGCDLRVINELMIHRELGTTARYIDIDEDDFLDGIRKAHPRP